ncbi:Oidioi.mRNA.OKI2018_I69.XSR.g15172.t1.cds [Oikopleura dioica]|uniref:Oidioi.mRNA.OKI2018_I69.XSR.g15172.t1.cds n=1 Tax=Oikopleura dioica TaxID=34765 RepID=A0ABN7SDS6_OIKDI|nr:Oidioi.mRNA.OKI2018_I69.XSR.g15172.t1.cds [Oikopleura dioica]
MQQNGNRNRNQNQYYGGRNIQSQMQEIQNGISVCYEQAAQARAQFFQQQHAQLLAQQQLMQQQQMMYPFGAAGGFMTHPVYMMDPSQNQIHLINMQGFGRNLYNANARLGPQGPNTGYIEPSTVATNIHPSIQKFTILKIAKKQQNHLYEQSRKLQQQQRDSLQQQKIQQGNGHQHPHVHVQQQMYHQQGMTRSNSQQSAVDSGRPDTATTHNDNSLPPGSTPHPSLLPANIPPHRTKPNQATEKKSLVIKTMNAEAVQESIQLDVTLDRAKKNVLQASVKAVPQWVTEPPTATEGQEDEDDNDYETEDEVEIEPVIPPKDSSKHGLRIAKNQAEATEMINKTMEQVTQDDVTTGMLASNASSIKRKKSRVPAMSKSMNNPGYVSNPGGQFQKRKLHRTMENIEQINDIKEKLNNLTSTFNECTIHEEIERGHVPSQESVKSSSTPYKGARAGTYKELRKELTRLEDVPAVARNSHPIMPQRPPIEEKNFHQQDFYDPEEKTSAREATQNWVGISQSVTGLDRVHMPPRLSVHRNHHRIDELATENIQSSARQSGRFSTRRYRERSGFHGKTFHKPTAASNLGKSSERRVKRVPLTRTEPKPPKYQEPHENSCLYRTIQATPGSDVQVTFSATQNLVREEPSSQTRKKMGVTKKIFKSLFAKSSSTSQAKMGKGTSMSTQNLTGHPRTVSTYNDPAILHAQPSTSRMMRPQKSCNKLSLDDAPI